MNLTQTELAKRSGVSLGSLKRLELSGQISLKLLLKLAQVLNRMGGFELVFNANDNLKILTNFLVIELEIKKM